MIHKFEHKCKVSSIMFYNLIQLKKHLLSYCFIITVSFCQVTLLHAQDTINVLVKVYDLQLNPVSNLEITIQEAKPTKTNTEGIAFIMTPEASLPPSNIHISDQKLEIESWNYSKGTLEIIVREKKYKRLIIKIIDLKNNAALPGIEVNINSFTSTPLISDANGNISLVLPISVQVNDPNLFSIEGYRIARKNLDEGGGTLIIEEIKRPKVSKIIEPKEDTGVLQDLNLEDLDSITSLTVFYALLKKTNYDELDSVAKNKLDDKFNELVILETDSLIPPLNTMDLISDSSVIHTDIALIIEKIQSEEFLLGDSRKEFEIATNQIKSKLTDGGTNLSIEEREQLIQLVTNMKNLLRSNEELFYKNNTYYREQVNSLINQVANVYELEDLLLESEETYSAIKEQLAYTLLAFTGIIGITALLIYLIRILRSQKNELARANEEIIRINSNLEGLVAKKTKSLELINNELDTFLYRSSHNLRRPLTSIRGLANVAKISLNEEGVSLFEKVVLTIKNMENMLDKLTMMSHLNQPTNFDILDLNQIADKLRSRLSNEMAQFNILFNVTIPQDIQFKSYPFTIEIILFNLLENAFFFCKFSKNQRPQVDMTMRLDEDDNLCITVRDNGRGIQSKYHEKIWNMFYVANDKLQGSGLGLYITKKAVESIQGTITLNTKLGQYCEFNILLPVLHPKSKDPKKSETLESIS